MQVYLPPQLRRLVVPPEPVLFSGTARARVRVWQSACVRVRVCMCVLVCVFVCVSE